MEVKTLFSLVIMSSLGVVTSGVTRASSPLSYEMLSMTPVQVVKSTDAPASPAKTVKSDWDWTEAQYLSLDEPLKKPADGNPKQTDSKKREPERARVQSASHDASRVSRESRP